MIVPTACALTLASLLVQSPGMATQAAPAVPGRAAGSTDYRVGPGDLLELSVAGRPELDRLTTVQPTGTVRLPGSGDLAVSGLTTDEIAARVAAALVGAGTAPAVLVRVAEHRSQFVWVRGAVGRPGRKPLRGATRLVDALLEAGGFAATASGELIVERPGGFADGSPRLHLTLRAVPGERELRQLALPLRPGDVVTAAVQRWVRVSGAVRRPGRYPLGEDATLRGVVATAGGPLRGATRAVVRQRDASGPARRISADLDAIERGRADDVPLLAGDEVVVGERP